MILDAKEKPLRRTIGFKKPEFVVDNASDGAVSGTTICPEGPQNRGVDGRHTWVDPQGKKRR